MISSRQNARWKDIRRLRRCKGDHALLDGVKLVDEALDCGLELTTTAATADFLEGPAARRLLPRLARAPLVFSPALFSELVDSDSPQGILAVARLPRPQANELALRPGTYLFVDGVQDPGNLGALARVAEASGVQAVFASAASAHPNHPRAQRAAAGSLLRLPWAPGATVEEVARVLRALDPTWVGLEGQGATSLYDFEPQGTQVLVLGSEGQGLSSAALALCSVRLRIPMKTPVESLNAATAAAVVLFELQRRAAETT